MSSRRGAAMIYVLTLTVCLGVGLSFALRQSAQAYQLQRRAEQRTADHYALGGAMAVEESEILAGTRTATSYTATPSFGGSAASASMTRTQIDGRPVYYSSVQGLRRGDEVGRFELFGLGRASTFRQWHWAAQAYAGDFLTGGQPAANEARGAPNWSGVKLSSTRGTSASVTFNDFSIPAEISPNSISSLRSHLGNPNFDNFELFIFGSDPWPWTMSQLTLEISRGSSRMRIVNPLSSPSSPLWFINPNIYRSIFFLPPPPNAGQMTSLTAIDLDAYPGGTAIKDGTGPLNVTFHHAGPSFSDQPVIDAVAWNGPTDTRIGETGLLAEIGDILTNGNWPGSIIWVQPTAARADVRRIETSPDIVSASNMPNFAIGAPNFYWFITYSGFFTAPSTGQYRFFGIAGDNALRIWANDVLAYDQYSGFVQVYNLTAGQTIPIWWESMDGGGFYNVQSRFTVDGGAQQTFDAHVTPGFGAEQIYFTDFSATTAMPEWSWAGIRTSADSTGPQGQTLPVNGVTTFPDTISGIPQTRNNVSALGDFGNTGNFALLTLGSQRAGRYILQFDFICIHSWDNNNAWGPDQIRVDVNGTTVHEADPVYYASSYTRLSSGTTEIMRYGTAWHSPNTYRTNINFRIEFDHPGGPLTLRFASTGPQIQVINDESWALDNIHLRRKRTGWD